MVSNKSPLLPIILASFLMIHANINRSRSYLSVEVKFRPWTYFRNVFHPIGLHAVLDDSSSSESQRLPIPASTSDSDRTKGHKTVVEMTRVVPIL